MPTKNRPSRSTNWRSLCLFIVLTVIVSACSSARLSVDENIPAAQLRWPAPPEPARVVWSRDISDYRSAGIERGFWKKVVDFVSGAQLDRIAQPYGILVDGDGRLLVVDVAMAAVHVMDLPANQYLRVFGAENQQLLTPIAVTEDGQGQYYLTDAESGAVYRFKLDAQGLQLFARLGRPTGIAFDRNGQRLYVTDTAAHQVVVFDTAGRELSRIGRRGTGPGEFNYPTDLFITDDGQLYVTDPLNRRIQVFSLSGTYRREVRGDREPPGFANPKGVAVDSSGNLYVCAPLADAVLVYDRDGRYRFAIGSRGTGAGQFWMPSGIHIDARDTIYVADTYNRRVQVFKRVTDDN